MLRLHSFSSTLNFKETEQDIWRLHDLVFCCAANQFTDFTCTFLRFQTEERILRYNKSKITGENTYNGDHFQIGDNDGSSKDNKILV